jgi:trans-aconitate methyltransferase
MVMKYQAGTTIIPQEHRADINEKILALINSTDMQGITAQDVYEAYTGVGGLHGLKRSEYNNYVQFSDAKKEIENGQFFSPAQVIQQIADLLQPGDTEFLCDPTCGAGAFFNHFNEAHCYGNELDVNAVDVAKFLYPKATIQCGDLKYYRPAIKFDYVVGNPPFNLLWKIDGQEIKSQLYFCHKSFEILKPGGLLICIVPQSFLADEFFNKSAIADMNERYNFLFQYNLASNAFAPMGVASFDTKVICFQKQAEAIEHTPYSNVTVTIEQADVIMRKVQQERGRLKLKLQAEFMAGNREFAYKSGKYLYEIKTHAVLKDHYAKAVELTERLKNQVKPSDMKDEEWNKVKLTEKKVLRTLRRIVGKQNKRDINKVALVKTQQGFRLKAYSAKAQRTLTDTTTHVYFNDLVTGEARADLIIENRAFQKLALRRKRDFELHTKPFSEFGRDPKIDAWLKRFTFISPKDLSACEFNDMQYHDMGIILQKKYGTLNWQQGCGKTAASYAWAKYQGLRNTFIIGPAVAIDMTWKKFMLVNNETFIVIKKFKDIQKIRPGLYVLMSLDMLIRYQRYIKAYVKRSAYKVALVFDESDEITSAGSRRTKATLSCFRKVKRKLLATGTTTRNNITELYSQAELLYNNSINMICRCEKIYQEEYLREKDGGDGQAKIREKTNKYFMQPFPPYYGPMVFKNCFNPAKSSVFGIQKHNQDIYNEEHLRGLISQMILTRKFREIAGDKYTVKTLKVQQTMAERHVYRKIISELQSVIPGFFTSTGNSRKDSMLNIIRQLNLLIRATSMPQSFDFYHGDSIPSKARGIIKHIEDHNEKVAVGCTSIEAVEWYCDILAAQFPTRQVFRVVGEISFTGRQNVIKEFEATPNGILVCTQQSLKSSVNIPTCNQVLIESLQWNIPKMEQFYFRFIRYDSADHTTVTFINYDNTIEMNLLALLMAKEKLNDYIKTLEYREDSDIYDEFGIDTDILSSLLTKDKDEDGKFQIGWGQSELV